jgi:hypothetical protein
MRVVHRDGYDDQVIPEFDAHSEGKLLAIFLGK